MAKIFTCQNKQTEYALKRKRQVFFCQIETHPFFFMYQGAVFGVMGPKEKLPWEGGLLVKSLKKTLESLVFHNPENAKKFSLNYF